MKLSATPNSGQNLITSYAPGQIQLAQQILQRSSVIMADQLIDWNVTSVEDLSTGAFDTIAALQPELVLLATGDQQRFPIPALMAYLPSRGIGLEVMTSAAACRTYNVLVAEDRRVALAVIL